MQNHVRLIIKRFRETTQLPHGTLLPSTSPIQGVVLSSNEAVRSLASYLNEKGFNVKPIVFPTVPVGQERVRICLHGHNTIDQVDGLVRQIHQFFTVADSSILEVSKL